MKIQAGICDDEPAWRGRAEDILRSYAKRTGMEMEIVCFADREDLLDWDEEALDVLFMDIELEKDNGITVARIINEKWSHCQIVYLTNYLYYATEIYDTRHIFYMLKEQFEQRIDKMFEKVLHELRQPQKHLIFSVIGGTKLVLAPEEIYYFERIRRVTAIATVNGRYEVWDKLDEIGKMLPALDFVRCHNSYIVYLPAIKELSKNVFYMKDGTEIIVSRSYAKKVKEEFSRWALTQIS